MHYSTELFTVDAQIQTHTHTCKYAHLYSAISSFLSPMAMHPGSNSHLFIQHSPSSIPPEFISEYLLYLLPLLLSRSGGIIAFVRSPRRTRNGSSNRPSVSSSHSPRGLALQQGAVRVKRVEMDKQRVLSCRCVAALLAHVQLVASLLVGVLQGDAVDLLHVRLQRAALGEGLVAEVALVWTDACMRAHVSFEVEGVIEAFAAEAAQVSLCVVVTLDVSVQHPLVLESLLADLAHERSRRPTLTLTRGSGHH